MDLEELKALAAREMARHGLQEWTFHLANTKRRLGACKYRTKRIEIAEYYAQHTAMEHVLDTLLHEIAHALAGPEAGHGPIWKAVAIRLGATPHACEKSQNVVVKPGDWQATCPSCAKTFHRYRKPRVLTGYRCRCAAGSPLAFRFAGETPRWEPPSQMVQQTANWEARCAGCGTVHLRVRKPKDGDWRCRCPHRCSITWQLRPASSPSAPR